MTQVWSLNPEDGPRKGPGPAAWRLRVQHNFERNPRTSGGANLPPRGRSGSLSARRRKAEVKDAHSAAFLFLLPTPRRAYSSLVKSHSCRVQD